MIQVENLSKQFGQFLAVDRISFSVGRGEVLGFLGPNGAGKSTTMKMITGFMPPSAGTVRVCGHDVTSDPIPVKAAIGYLPEGAPLYPDMDPEGFLRFIAEVRGYRGDEKNRRVENAARLARIEAVMHRPIDTLSKGFKRRVGLAQAILHDPAVLIMDEPTDGLDPNQKHEVRRLISDMAPNKAIIVSTHILEEVAAVCTRAIIIAAGRLRFDGSPAQLLARSKTFNAVKLAIQCSQPGTAGRALEQLPGVDRVEVLSQSENQAAFLVYPKDGRSIIREIGQAVKVHDWMVDELRVDSGQLDAVFREITTGGNPSETERERTP